MFCIRLADSEDSDEDEDDDELGGIPNSDVESGSDEDLAALLESTSALVGRKSSTRRAAAAAEDDRCQSIYVDIHTKIIKIVGIST
jgi:hypothetical protein